MCLNIFTTQHSAFLPIISSQNHVVKMEQSGRWQESSTGCSSMILFLLPTCKCKALQGSILGHFLFSLYLVSWHKFIYDHGFHCHNKQITLFSEFPTQFHVSRKPQDSSPWTSPWHVKLNMLKVNDQLLPQTSSSSHTVFQFASLSLSSMVYLETWRAYLTLPLTDLPYPSINLAYRFYLLFFSLSDPIF